MCEISEKVRTRDVLLALLLHIVEVEVSEKVNNQIKAERVCWVTRLNWKSIFLCIIIY